MLGLVFEGEIDEVSEIKTLFKKKDGRETTEVSGFSQEIVIYQAAVTDDFGKEPKRREQFFAFRVWSSKSMDTRFMPIGEMGVVKIKANLDGQRFKKVEEVNGVPTPKVSYFSSLNLSAWKKVADRKSRPVIEAKVAEGKETTDELPF